MERSCLFIHVEYKKRNRTVTLGCILLGLSIMVSLFSILFVYDKNGIDIVSPLWIFDDFQNWFGVLLLATNVILLVYAWSCHHAKKSPLLFIVSLGGLCAEALLGILSAFPIFSIILFLCQIVPCVLLGICAIISFVKISSRTTKAKDIRTFLTIAVFFASCNITPIFGIWTEPRWWVGSFPEHLRNILLLASLLILLPNILKDYTLPKKVAQDNNGYTTTETVSDITPNDKAFCGLGKHVVLLLFTFGVWQCIWVYRTTRFLNKAPSPTLQYHPTKKLLLYIFVPFYSIYWFYKHGQRLDSLSAAKRLGKSDMATMCLVLGIFVPIVAAILMQDRINAICTAKPVQERASAADERNTADALREYKDLLDAGIITQEEFDAKKKQLLGL